MRTDSVRPPEPSGRAPVVDESQARGARFLDVLGPRPVATQTPMTAEDGGSGLENAGADLDEAGVPPAGTSCMPLGASPSSSGIAVALGAASRRLELATAGPRRASSHEPLDPCARQLAAIAPPLSMPADASASPAASTGDRIAHASLEELLPALVRRIAWSGDGRKGSLSLEFAAGALAGGALVVHSDEGRVRVAIRAPQGADVDAWRERIAARLDERGLVVEELVVE